MTTARFAVYYRCGCTAWTPGTIPEHCPEHGGAWILAPELVPVTPLSKPFGLWHDPECLDCPHTIEEDA